MNANKELITPKTKLFKRLLYISIISCLIGIILFFVAIYLQYFHETLFESFYILIKSGISINWLQYLAFWIILTGFILAEMVIVLYFIFKKIYPFTRKLRILKLIANLSVFTINITLLIYIYIFDKYLLGAPIILRNIFLSIVIISLCVLIGSLISYYILKKE